MSANLDLVRSMYVAFAEGDYSSTEWADPEIEFVVAYGPDPGSWHGLRGLAASALDTAARIRRAT
jgi:ketosteroid isomerase-like protein